MVVSAMAILLMASLVVMLYYSRKVLKDEAIQKATQTLAGTVQCVDNILLSVEQAAGNVYFTIPPHLNNQEKLREYSRRLVETNPYVVGCAIAMKPYFYKDRRLFMAYAHYKRGGLAAKKSPIVMSETFGNTPYTEQAWFTTPMETCKPAWMVPMESTLPGMEPIVTFSLPLVGADGKPIGIIGVDVSLNHLSQIVLATKPSANSYCTLLDNRGFYIVHPDSRKLMRQTVFKQMENENDAAATIREAAQAMGKGETGYKPFSMDNTDYYIFYKPFIRAAVPGRAMENLNWSAGIIYPENDIFGDYNRLIYYVFAIAVVGLLLLFVCSRSLIHHQLLPLRMLTASTQRIARGNYNEEIPYSPQKDEIGQLQNHFQQMQESLATNVGELEQLTTTLHEHEVELKAAYDRMRQADRMKTVFLHNMTNQMIRPTTVIMNNVQTLCDIGYHVNVGERLVGDILQQGETVAELLDNLLRVAENETNKEGGL